MKKNEFITLRDYAGALINSWPSVAAAAKDLGITGQTVRNLLAGYIKNSFKVKGKLAIETIGAAEPQPTFINLPDEEWKVIKGYENYEVSNCGRIRRGDKLLQGGKTTNYITVSLRSSFDGTYTTFYVHRLVGEYFLPDWDPELTINHKDENKQNNHISNLEQMTLSENAKYSYELHKDTWGSRKNRKNCKKVRCVETGVVYESLHEAARAVGAGYSTSISYCCSGKLKTAHGYHWEYAKEED